MPHSNQSDLYHKLHNETARITWDELIPHFARGVLILVGPSEDLVNIAHQFANDDRHQVELMLENGAVRLSSDADALGWNSTKPEFWAVVAAPWVLVQEILETK
jgi:hypothetical protein